MELEILKIMVRKMNFSSRFLRSLLLLPVLSALFVSCEQNADVDLPEVPSKLVVVSFLTPQDTLVRVRVTKSRPIFQASNVDLSTPVSDATVMLYGNNGSVQLGYNSQLGQYTVPASQFPVIPGNEYRIEVSAPQLTSVSATTTVPSAAPADFSASRTYTIDSSDTYQWKYSVDAAVSFTDYAADGDYYRLSTSLVNYLPSSQDTLFWLFGNSFLRDNDGQLIQQNSNYRFTFSSPTWGGDHPVAIDFSLVHCSPEYYLYHQSLYANNNGDDPFSEPTLMYTNIKDGYGVFAGANYVIRRIYF